MIQIPYEILSILLAICGAIVLINNRIKKTVIYRNKFLYAENFMKTIPSDIEFATIGSTYSVFAAQALNDLKRKAYSMGSFSRPINYDYLVLNKYIGNFAHGAKIALFLGVCVCVCSPDYEDTSGTHYAILKFLEMNKPDIRLWCAYHFPIVQFFKYLKSSDNGVLSIDEKYRKMIGKNTYEALMKIRRDTWIRQFSLDNLTDEYIHDKALQAVSENTKYLKMIQNLCRENKLDLIIVIPPFSKYLNKHIGSGFAKKVLYEPIESVFLREQIYDYREHPVFQEQYDLFVDGGFLLNYKGSYKFCQLLLDDINERNK